MRTPGRYLCDRQLNELRCCNLSAMLLASLHVADMPAEMQRDGMI